MRLSVVIFLAIIFGITLGADNKPTTGNKSGTIEIVVNDLNSNNGYLRAQLFNSDKSRYFPDKSEYCYKFSLVKIKNNKAKIIFQNVPFGKYAITIHHDENSNEKLDKTWLGMPDEGWGISTDIVPVFSLPDFDECSFELKQDYLRYEVLIRYLP